MRTMQDRIDETVEGRRVKIAAMPATFTSVELRMRFDCNEWLAREIVSFGYRRGWLTRKRHGTVVHYTKTPVFECLPAHGAAKVAPPTFDEGRTLALCMGQGLLGGFRGLAALRRVNPGAL